jgi:HD superfamily phosphohydrolase/tRNA A-37 threonylcarbamoyl transferase component Bud32
MSGDDRHYDVTVIAGETLDGTDCLVLHKSGEVEPAEAAVPVESGNAGVVYRAQWQHGIEVALKLLSPKRELVELVDSDAFKTTFDREIALLAKVTHTRIAKILFSGTARPRDDDVPFYAMEFVEGDRFGEFVTSGEINGRAFLDLVDQVLDGVEYLHARQFMHADLKSENILIRRQGTQLDAKIVDLGVAKVLESAPELAQNAGDGGADDGTYFYSTKRITRPEWHPRLGKRIPRSELLEMFPGHDLFSLGVLIAEVVEHPQFRGQLAHDLGEPALNTLEQIRDRLLGESVAGPYPDVRALRTDWQKLQPGYLAPLGVPELALAAQAKTSIATPGGRVSLTARTLAAINHPMMQRLRNIPQLEFAHLIYPGATHTRLLHSISTFDISRRFVSNLLRDPSFRLLVSPEEVEATLVMALCHDVGHYPLSHMFEDWSHQETQAGETRRIPTDDDLFWVLIDRPNVTDDPFYPLAEIAEEALADGSGDLHSFLFESGRFSPETLAAARAIRTMAEPSHRLLRGIIDSQIDADKIAYLADDSLMTGVRYGLGIDLDALLASLRAPHPADIPAGHSPVIAISDKGLPAAEQVMLARYWMLRRVYWHHTNRAIMAMVKFVIATIDLHVGLDMQDYFEATLFGEPRDGLEYLSAAFNAQVPIGEDGTPTLNPLGGLIGAQRGLYKRILTFAKGDAEASGALYEALAQRKSEALLAATECARESIQEVAGSLVRRGEVLIDVPLKERSRAASTMLVYLRKGADSPSAIEQASPVIGHLVNEFDTHVRKARLYVHPQLHERLEQVGLDAVRSAVVPALEQHCGVS